MKTAVSIVLIAGLYILHQDFWFWRQARPLVFGALPVGLFYHAVFTVATSVVLAVLVRLLWPESLELRLKPELTPESPDRESTE